MDKVCTFKLKYLVLRCLKDTRQLHSIEDSREIWRYFYERGSLAETFAQELITQQTSFSLGKPHVTSEKSGAKSRSHDNHESLKLYTRFSEARSRKRLVWDSREGCESSWCGKNGWVRIAQCQREGWKDSNGIGK